KQLFSKKSRPASRRRPARVRLGLEALEAREVPAVSAFVDGFGVLEVATNNHDDVTIDHTTTALGPTTLGNGRQFPDFHVSTPHTQGEFGLFQDAFFNVNILATSKPLTADDSTVFNVGTTNGHVSTGTGNMHNILAPLSLGTADIANLDDSGDPT